MTILIPTLILVGIAIACAALLTLASVFFAVKEDETAVAIRDCLPGANCGACGYSGCDGYAKALAEKSTDKTNLCVPGGDSTAKGIAEILGVEAEDVIEQVAFVACNGTCDAAPRKCDLLMMSLPPPRSMIPIFLSVLMLIVSFKLLNLSIVPTPMVQLSSVMVRAILASSKVPPEITQAPL